MCGFAGHSGRKFSLALRCNRLAAKNRAGYASLTGERARYAVLLALPETGSGSWPFIERADGSLRPPLRCSVSFIDLRFCRCVASSRADDHDQRLNFQLDVARIGRPASAANSTAPAAPTDARNAIVVTGIRQSLRNSQQIKRNSDTVVDAITAQDIGALPDRSVTEALQRVPGVAINRFAGTSDPDHFSVEGSGVIIRGLTYVARNSTVATHSRPASMARRSISRTCRPSCSVRSRCTRTRPPTGSRAACPAPST